MDDTALFVEINALMVRGQIAWKRGASIISVILPVEESNTALWLVDLISCPNYTMSRLRVILGTTDFGRAKLAQEKPVSGSWASCRMRGCWSVQNSTHRAVLKPLSSLAWPTLARQLVGGASGPLETSLCRHIYKYFMQCHDILDNLLSRGYTDIDTALT